MNSMRETIWSAHLVERLARIGIEPAAVSAARALHLVRLGTRVGGKEFKRDAAECIQTARQVIALHPQIDCTT